MLDEFDIGTEWQTTSLSKAPSPLRSAGALQIKTKAVTHVEWLVFGVRWQAKLDTALDWASKHALMSRYTIHQSGMHKEFEVSTEW